MKKINIASEFTEKIKKLSSLRQKSDEIIVET